MTISILRADISDAAATVNLGMRAFEDDTLQQLTLNLRTATPEQVQQWRQWRTSMSEMRMSGPGKYYFKAIDSDTGELVGFIGMYAPEAYDAQALGEAPTPAPDFVNHEVGNEFRTAQAATSKKHLGDRKDVWFVQSLAVHPAHWGRGIGKKLLKRGLEEVDRARQDIYLEATPAATALYRSCGFEELDKIVLFEGRVVMAAMMRRYGGG